MSAVARRVGVVSASTSSSSSGFVVPDLASASAFGESCRITSRAKSPGGRSPADAYVSRSVAGAVAERSISGGGIERRASLLSSLAMRFGLVLPSRPNAGSKSIALSKPSGAPPD